MPYFVLPLALAIAAAAVAADAPQFRGPQRDGIFPAKDLLEAWPAGGPALAWKAEGIGKGYAGVAVVDGTVYVPGMLEDGQGWIFAYGLDGALKWKASYGPETQERQAPGARATPTIEGGRLYMQSGEGVVVCMDAANGAVLWQADAMQRFAGVRVDWAISESLLVTDRFVIVTPGGPDASVAALDKTNGETVWTSKGLSEASAYCSPMLFTFGGRPVIVTVLAKSIVGIELDTGKVLWTHAQETPYDIHAVSPVTDGKLIYFSAGSETGGTALAVSADGSSVTPAWSDKHIDCLHHGVVLVDGYLYGSGSKKRGLACLEFATGKLMWQTDEVVEASVVYADGMLYAYEGPKKGVVNLVKASPAGYERTGTFLLAEGRDKHWAHPVVAQGKLFLRYEGVLYAYGVSAR